MVSKAKLLFWVLIRILASGYASLLRPFVLLSGIGQPEIPSIFPGMLNPGIN